VPSAPSSNWRRDARNGGSCGEAKLGAGKGRMRFGSDFE